MHSILATPLVLGLLLGSSRSPATPPLAAPGSPLQQPAAAGGLVARENPVRFKRAFDDEAVKVRIGLRNTGARTIHLHNIRGSCGCMRVGEVPPSLAPGQEVELEFSLQLAGFAGRVSKFARVFSDDPLTPELRVHIEGEVGPRLVIEPGRAVVERAAPDQPAVADVTIRSGADEALAGLTAVASLPGVELTTTIEGTAARLRVLVPKEIAHPRGTITIRLGTYERVLRLTDGSTAAEVVSSVRALPGSRWMERQSETSEGSPRLAVAFSGQDLGELEPCGCTQGMFGGLARRPARLHAFVEPEVPFAALSGGALVAGSEPYDRLRLEALVEALGTMGFAALAPTRRELALETLRAADAAASPAPPLVAVDVDEDSVGERDLWRMLRLEVGDAFFYVTGISAPPGSTEAVPGLRFVDPAPALRELRAELPVHAPLVILANLGEEAARELARNAGGPTLVLYAGGWTDPGPEDVEEGSLAFAPYPAAGKFLGLARLHGRGATARWSVEYRPVEAELPEDEAMLALHRSHRERMRAADLVSACASNPRFTPAALAEEPALALPLDPTQGYVGSAACASCHTEASRSWAASRHARAWQTLRTSGDDADPACVACHVVGYGTGRGFRSEEATPHLSDVGCEACHGPRRGHVEFRSDLERVLREREPPAPEGRTACAACHDPKHDPNFQFDTHWQRIVHGR